MSYKPRHEKNDLRPVQIQKMDKKFEISDLGRRGIELSE